VPIGIYEMSSSELSCAEATLRFQTMVRRFGELLRTWPEILKAVRELRNGGLTLAESLPTPPRHYSI